MEVPRITKITLNMGVGEAVADKKVFEHAVSDMTKIAGQKPVVTKSRKSIAGFKIRDGYPIGCMVTLRGPRMFEFRSSGYRGVAAGATSAVYPARALTGAVIAIWASKSRSSFRKSSTTRSMRCAANISVTTTAKTDEEARALLVRSNFRSRIEAINNGETCID